jgi:Activator of Hsp90 ATPase homolog 1-like protein
MVQYFTRISGTQREAESMSDENGNMQTPAAMVAPEGHPTTTEVRVELVASDDHTDMVLTHVGTPADSPGAMGWNMALDKLVAYVDAHVNQ